MQLVAYGAQDIYLTGNPQITFFKVVYRRHTNFSMECIAQTFTGSVDFGRSTTATLSRNGDLISGLYLTFSPSEVCGVASAFADLYTCANVGWGIIDEVSVEIGGQQIDRHYGKWMNVWNDLTQVNPSCGKGTVDSVGQIEHENNPKTAADYDPAVDDEGWELHPGTATQARKTSFNVGGTRLLGTRALDIHEASVPLEFWFCRNPGLALPLIALQYHEVKINLSFSEKAKITASEITASGDSTAFLREPTLANAKLWADYIYLDTDERRRFAQVSHEYLIEQLQTQSFPLGQSASFTLNFNHPVKELIWTGTPNAPNVASYFRGTFFMQTDQGPSVPMPLGRNTGGTYPDPLSSSKCKDVKWTIKLNGHERFAPRHSSYFTGTQVVNHHSGNSGVIQPDSIYVYSFALKPEEHQPSGTCNFSRIDNAQLVPSVNDIVTTQSANQRAMSFVTAKNGSPLVATNSIDVYAVNYNVLRIMSGMGGLAYSN